MSSNDHGALDKAAKAQRLLDRAADGAKAMAEYEAGRLAVEANTVRLRALRLERERAEADAAPPVPATKVKGRKALAGGPA